MTSLYRRLKTVPLNQMFAEGDSVPRGFRTAIILSALVEKFAVLFGFWRLVR